MEHGQGLGNFLCLDLNQELETLFQEKLKTNGYSFVFTAWPQELTQLDFDKSDGLVIFLREGVLEKLTALQSQEKVPPIILLAERRNITLLSQALKLGGFSYLLYGPDYQNEFLELFSAVVQNTFICHQRAIELQTNNSLLKQQHSQMSDFVSIVSHDLRNPLGYLNHYHTILTQQEDLSDEEKNTILERIGSINQKMSKLVDELLDLSLIKAGKMALNIEYFDFFELTLELLPPLQILIGKKEIQFKNAIPESTMVWGDQNRLAQVMNNLISNAIKFTPHNGKITLEAIKDARGHRIQIIDSGVGIAKENLPKLFREHIKFSTLGTDSEKGTGYGLHLAQEILQAHDSRIEVESEPNQGSCFSFVLPTEKL